MYRFSQLCFKCSAAVGRAYCSRSSNYGKTARPLLDVNAYLMLSIPVATFGLGVWQIRRRSWKLDLISNLEAKCQALPIDFPEDLEELKDLTYRRVKVRGSFDHSRETYLGPRSLIVDGASDSKGGLISSAQSGVYVITPFKFDDRDLTILVNRGWVPRGKTNPKTRPEGQVQGTVDVVGVVRDAERRGPFMPVNKPGSRTWLYRDIDAMAEQLDCAPIFLDATASSTVPKGPIGGQTRVSLRNEHLSYIFTWFSLSGATSYMWYRKYIRRLPII